MRGPRRPGTRICEIAIRVRDLECSVQFYRDILGFDARPAASRDGATMVCGTSRVFPAGCTIVLIQGLPRPFEPVGLDHVTIVLAGRQNLDELYESAVNHGYQAIRPRDYAGRYQAFIFDPDGYKFAIVAAPPAEGGHAADVPGATVSGNS